MFCFIDRCGNEVFVGQESMMKESKVMGGCLA